MAVGGSGGVVGCIVGEAGGAAVCWTAGAGAAGVAPSLSDEQATAMAASAVMRDVMKTLALDGVILGMGKSCVSRWLMGALQGPCYLYRLN